MKCLDSAKALLQLRRTGVLVDVRLSMPLSLEALGTAPPWKTFHYLDGTVGPIAFEGPAVDQEVRIVRCSLAALDATSLEFCKPVSIEDCEIGLGVFIATYFHAGLDMTRCRFTGTVDFQCGGHNRDGAAFKILDTQFDGFVNFYDCWYRGPVEIRQCTFRNGTNLLGNKGRPYEVSFDVPPVVAENSGRIDVDGEDAA